MFSCSSGPKYDIDRELDEVFNSLNKSLDDLLNVAVDKLPGRSKDQWTLHHFLGIFLYQSNT